MGTNGKLQVIPLGGLGEFGMNMMALRWDDQIIVIDAGKMFPEDSYFGVESIIPDMTFIRENRDKILGLFLTHGHEDHIGAVPYFRKIADVPVFGTRLTLGLVRMRLSEHNLASDTDLREVEKGERIDLGDFSVEFIGVSHGIPDSCALAVTTPAGVIIHTGDFKLDQTPLDGQTTDYHSLSRYGEEGVLLLLGDSTNAEYPGYTFSEREVYEGFEQVFLRAEGKILVAAFASHLHRMQQVVDLAEKFNRKVAFCGRSMEQNSRLAQELGYLRLPAGLEISPKQVASLPPSQVVVIASGSQAEPNSALTKIALDIHSNVKLKPGDLVALSARKIPGNERSIANIINHLNRRGAEVEHNGTLDLHVSGHAFSGEMRMMLNLVKPRFFVPVHGEYHQLHLHAALARGTCVEEGNVLQAESGDVIEVDQNGIGITGHVTVGRQLVSSSLAEDISEEALRDRRYLAQEGLVAPIIVVRKKHGPKVVNIHFITKGLRSEEDHLELLTGAEALIRDLVEESTLEELADDDLMQAKIGKALRRLMRRQLQTRPMILPRILEV
jgi:ribonuclease J